MTISRVKMEKNLPKKGFEKDSGKDHIYFYLKAVNKHTGIYTKLSHSKKMKDIEGGLLSAIKMQLHLDKSKQLEDLINCPMSQKDYLKILKDKSLI